MGSTLSGMDPWVWFFAAVLTVLASARLARLIVFDVFPPVVWLRERFLIRTGGTAWEKLATCHYCLTFWTTSSIVGVGYVTGLAWWWWMIVASLGLSYAAAIVVSYDGDD